MSQWRFNDVREKKSRILQIFADLLSQVLGIDEV